MDTNLYFQNIITQLVLPGMLGGFLIYISMYFISLGISLAINLIFKN